jgi:hypothetical protein
MQRTPFQRSIAVEIPQYGAQAGYSAVALIMLTDMLDFS